MGAINFAPPQFSFFLFFLAREMREISHVNCGLKTRIRAPNISYRWLANTSEHEGVSPSAPCATFSSKSEDATAFAAAQAKMHGTAMLALHASEGEVFPGEPSPSPVVPGRNWFRQTSALRLQRPRQPDGPDSEDPPTLDRAFISSSSSLKNHTVPVRCTVMRGAIAMHRTHQSGVDGQLTTAEQEKPVHNHFQTAASTGRSISLIKQFVPTRPPASLQMRAAALSRANPLLPALQTLRTQHGSGQTNRLDGHTATKQGRR